MLFSVYLLTYSVFLRVLAVSLVIVIIIYLVCAGSICCCFTQMVIGDDVQITLSASKLFNICSQFAGFRQNVGGVGVILLFCLPRVG